MANKKSTDTKTTALTTVVDNTQVANQFFNIDFAAMNTVIDKLANRGSLSKVEKKEANDIIDTWNHNVVDKLNIESNNIQQFIGAITGTTSTGIPALIQNQEFISELEMLIDYAGLQDEYNEMCDTVDEYMVADAERRNLPTIDNDIDTTAGQLIMMQRDYDYRLAQLNANVRKIGNKLTRQNIAMTSALMANSDVKTLITQLKKRVNNMKKMKTSCTDKAQLAKINITIDDAAVRDTLKELIELTKF